MSLKQVQLLALFLFFSGFGFSAYQFIVPSKKIKKSFAPPISVSQYSSHGVVDRILKLQFKTKSIGKSDQAVTEVSASISLPFDFEGELHYKWTLGQNVTLVKGTLTGSSAKSLRQNVAQQIKIIVQGFEPSQLRHIGFEIWADKNGRRIFADGLISSQKENSFENIVQHVEKMKAKKLGIQK